MPAIGAILIDSEAKKDVCELYTKRKELFSQNDVRSSNLQSLLLKKIRFKIAIMKDGHIFMLYANPERGLQPTWRDVLNFDASSDD